MFIYLSITDLVECRFFISTFQFIESSHLTKVSSIDELKVINFDENALYNKY